MYARLNGDRTEILQTWGGKPRELICDEGHTGFPDGTSDEQYANFRIFPITQTNEPNYDGYHVNEISYSIVEGLPVSTYAITDIPLEEGKAIKWQDIENQWQELVRSGHFVSQTISGFEVDCRRNETDNDIQNIEGILGLYEAGVISEPIAWKGISEVRLLTHTQLQGLRIEMLGYGANIYQRKFTAMALIDSATTLEQVKSVTF